MMSLQHSPPPTPHLCLYQMCPWAAWARELRITSHEAIGDLQSAITDLRVTTKLTADNTEGFLRLATLYYRMGDVEQSLK